MRADGQELWVRIRSALTGNSGPAGQRVLREVEDITALVLGSARTGAVQPSRTRAGVGPDTIDRVTLADVRDLAAEMRASEAR